MKITAISDLHGNLPNLPKADITMVAGDFSPLRAQHNPPQMYSWIKKSFIPWIRSLDADFFVFIAGNHDFVCEDVDWKERFQEIVEDSGIRNWTEVIYLENEEVSINNCRIFGCPYSDIPGWAFSTARPDNANAYKAIPEGLDFLLVHQAPRFENVGTSNIGMYNERNFGSQSLEDEILAKMPKNVVCGHIHSGDHNLVTDGITNYYNVSLLDERYEVNYEPLTLTI